MQKQKKKKWVRPMLVVLVREVSGFSALTTCKMGPGYSTVGPGTGTCFVSTRMPGWTGVCPDPSGTPIGPECASSMWFGCAPDGSGGTIDFCGCNVCSLS
jgi:hypothetical protein